MSENTITVYLHAKATTPNDIHHNQVFTCNGCVHRSVGRITKIERLSNISIFGVRNMKTTNIHVETDLYIYTNQRSLVVHGLYEVKTPRPSEDMFHIGSNGDYTDVGFVKSIIENRHHVVLVDESKFDETVILAKTAANLKALYERQELYTKIMVTNDGVTTRWSLLDVLQTLPEEERWSYYMTIAHTSTSTYSLTGIRSLVTTAERILKSANIIGEDYLTQEEQVEAFIRYSKVLTESQEEIVPDSVLTAIRESDIYATTTAKLQEHGFGLSKTQQYNVLQQVGLMTSNRNHAIYNLSDMGAGKTLMTVQAIYMLDLKAIAELTSELDSQTMELASGFCTPDKNIIAPKLSIESSWIKTFELFYDVEKINDGEYKLTSEYNGITFTSSIFVSLFTVKSSTITVENALPKPAGHDYLIIDEIHQLVKRKVTRSRFLTDATPAKDYMTFVLSGTLSNLTTTEMNNLVRFLDIKYENGTLDSGTANMVKDSNNLTVSSTRSAIMMAANNINEEQNRQFDDNVITDESQLGYNPTSHKTNKDAYFHHRYSSHIINLNDPSKPLQHQLSRGEFRMFNNTDISDVQNFELFYQLFGSQAITAQSVQVAEELFGEQKTQHNADVIRTKSTLTPDDLAIIKVLHKITADHNIYKSQAIATRINNAILNLNDGLQDNNVYEIINRHANSNTKFLEYLATLDVNILEKLPESSLINTPKLEETEKFAILKDILSNEKDETHLIVVNDYTSMVKLSKALEIEHLTKKQVTDALNYQESIDDLYTKQSIVIVPQDMIKSSLDLVQANRLIQYQLNAEISDIIQTQNRINRIGQTRETKAYYIATDVLQENIIALFLETYQNIRVAHKGIVELFVDMSSQVNVINDYIGKALKNADRALNGETVAVTTATDTVSVTDVVVETELSDVVDGAEVSDIVEETEASDIVEETEVSDVVVEAEASDIVEETGVSDIVEETEVSDVVVEAEASDIVEETEVSDIEEETEVSDVVETETIDPFEDETGIYLFDPSEYTTDLDVVLSEEDEVIVQQETNPNQTQLFSPAHLAESHQLLFVG